MKSCEELQGYLIDLVLGEDIPSSIEAELEDHLAACDLCRRRLDEFKQAWRKLDVLEEVEFPENISQAVLRKVRIPPRPLRIAGYVYPLWKIASLAAAVILLVVLGVYIIFQGGSSVDPTAQTPVIYSASTFIPGQVSLPDLRLTMDIYLSETGKILQELREGRYSNWGAILNEIISRDIQGQANFLLEQTDLPPRARSIIGVLHDVFLQMLQSGRGHEKEEIDLPSGISLDGLLAEISRAKFKVNETQSGTSERK